ncbi:TPA: hypothetical protein I7145_22400 [Vibrio vulnificus]|nr:hypothetical protein [Vibrio vulnificus]
MSETKLFGEAFKIYNKHQRVVVQFQYTETQKDEYPSVTIEIAPLLGTDANWQEKISVQLTRYELTSFTQVLFGLARLSEGAYHGSKRKVSNCNIMDPKGFHYPYQKQGRLNSVCLIRKNVLN